MRLNRIDAHVRIRYFFRSSPRAKFLLVIRGICLTISEYFKRPHKDYAAHFEKSPADGPVIPSQFKAPGLSNLPLV